MVKSQLSRFVFATCCATSSLAITSVSMADALCTYNYECGSREICVFGQCQAGSQTDQCTYNNQCPGDNWFCLNGTCVQQGTGDRCWTNNDCPTGDICSEGACVGDD